MLGMMFVRERPLCILVDEERREPGYGCTYNGFPRCSYTRFKIMTMHLVEP